MDKNQGFASFTEALGGVLSLGLFIIIIYGAWFGYQYLKANQPKPAPTPMPTESVAQQQQDFKEQQQISLENCEQEAQNAYEQDLEDNSHPDPSDHSLVTWNSWAFEQEAENTLTNAQSACVQEYKIN